MALSSKAQLGIQIEDMSACLAPWLLLTCKNLFNLLLAIEKEGEKKN